MPPGALDLGFGAYVPLAAGWQVAGLGANAAQLTDGVTSVSIVVQQRPPGSTARDVLLDQVAGVDAAFPAVWYGVPTVQPGSGGTMASQRASVGYRAYGDGGQTSGQAIGVVRADGLAIGYAQRAAPGTSSTAYPGLEAAVASLAGAPPVAAPAEIADPGTAAVPSHHPQLLIDGTAGFTPAPSYRVIDAQPGYAFLTADGTYDVIVRGEVLATPGELVDSARQGVAGIFPGASFGAQTDFGPDRGGLVYSSVPVSATYFDGRALVGAIDTYWDPVTTHGYWLARVWFVTADGTEPLAGRGPVHGVGAVRLLRRVVSDGCSASGRQTAIDAGVPSMSDSSSRPRRTGRQRQVADGIDAGDDVLPPGDVVEPPEQAGDVHRRPQHLGIVRAGGEQALEERPLGVPAVVRCAGRPGASIWARRWRATSSVSSTSGITTLAMRSCQRWARSTGSLAHTSRSTSRRHTACITPNVIPRPTSGWCTRERHPSR